MKPELGVTVATEALVERYSSAEGQIAVALESAVPVLPDGTATDNRNVNRQFRRSQQRSMEAYIASILSQLDADTAAWVREHLPMTYADGMAKVKLMTDSVMPVAWNLMHRQAVTILAQDTMADLAAATAHMQAQAKAFIRSAAKAEVLDQVATGRAAAIGRTLAKRLQSEGLQAFVDSSGRSWKLSTYSAMVVRTKRQAAFNTGATLRMHQQGVTACLIIDGTRFDSDCTAINGSTCSVAWSLDHPLEHPQCTRTFAPLVPPPDSVDYGDLSDEVPVGQLGTKAPDEQLLYRVPPTIDPAANPARAASLMESVTDTVAPPPMTKLDDVLEQLAIQQGWPDDALSFLEDYELEDMQALYGNVPEATLVAELDDLLASKGLTRTTTAQALADQAAQQAAEQAQAAASFALKQQAEAAASWLNDNGYEVTATELLTKASAAQADNVEGFLKFVTQGLLKPVDVDHLVPGLTKVSTITLPGDLGDVVAKAVDDDIALGIAQQIEEASLQAVVAKDQLAIYKAAVQLDELADAFADLPQLSSGVTKIIRDKAKKLELTADAIEKQAAKQMAAAAKAADAATLDDMAKVTYTPTGSILPDPDGTRPPVSGDVDRLREQGQRWAKLLDSQERSAVTSYTGSAYRTLNADLRAGKVPNTSLRRGLDSALDKAGQLDEPALVWRGVRFTEAQGTWEQRADWAQRTFTPGSTVEWKGYSSTSTTSRVATDSFGGGGVVFEIQATRGAMIKSLSSFSSEDEFLLPRGARFEVVRVIRSAPFPTGPRTVVQLRQIG